MLQVVRKFGTGISTKLYCFAILSLVAVASLAAASIYFSTVTENAAQMLYGRGFVGVAHSARLETLLLQHRRIVESMPAEVDRKHIYTEQEELVEIQKRLDDLMQEISALDGDAVDSIERRISDSLPALFDAAKQVAYYAREFAQDKAVESVTRYFVLAENTQALVESYRNLRMQNARDAMTSVRDSAHSLAAWVLVCVAVSIVLIGPMWFGTMHNVLSRLRGITDAMHGLAANRTDTLVPSQDDADEVGAMARAVEVFKQNGIQLSARESELKQLYGRMDIALNNMTHGLCMFDSNKKLIVCNAAFMQMYALPFELGMPGTTLAQIREFRARLGNDSVDNPDRHKHPAPEQAILEPSSFTQQLKDGRVIAVSRQPIVDGGWVAVHEDITERQRAESKIAYLARHDTLTDLPNRLLFTEQLKAAFQSLEAGSVFAVHCLDLDQFKAVNDTLGHHIGDELLKVVADRLAETLSPADFVARIGGDEFAIIQRVVASRQDCARVASRIVEIVSRPYDIDGRHIVIGTSVGIAIAPADGENAVQLLKNADMALYRAKNDGRGMHRFFEQEMDRQLQTRRSLEIDMREALANGQFELCYQPIVSLSTGCVTSFEALIRWSHPTRGNIPPSQFIPLAEESGLILPLGEWALRRACSDAVHWPEPISVAINLSAIQFKGRNILKLAMGALGSSGLSPDRLDLEITESLLLQDESNTLATLHQLRSIGIHIALDDFGTGYSSLAYLRKFPIDKIKIDRSFVQDMLIRKDCEAIIRAVSDLAQSLNITTVVEGVETVEQCEAARAFGCHEAQGYLFSKAMPQAAIFDYLARRSAITSAA